MAKPISGFCQPRTITLTVDYFLFDFISSFRDKARRDAVLVSESSDIDSFIHAKALAIAS